MTSMILCMGAALNLDNDGLDAAIAAEEGQLLIDGETEPSLWLTALLRVQRERIAAGRALVRECESLEDQDDVLRVGDRVEYAVNRGAAGWCYYPARVVALTAAGARVEYRQANGRIRAATVPRYGRSHRAIV